MNESERRREREIKRLSDREEECGLRVNERIRCWEGRWNYGIKTEGEEAHDYEGNRKEHWASETRNFIIWYGGLGAKPPYLVMINAIPFALFSFRTKLF